MIVIWSHFISILFLELELSRDLAWADPHLAVVWVVIRTLKKTSKNKSFDILQVLGSISVPCQCGSTLDQIKHSNSVQQITNSNVVFNDILEKVFDARKFAYGLSISPTIPPYTIRTCNLCYPQKVSGDAIYSIKYNGRQVFCMENNAAVEKTGMKLSLGDGYTHNANAKARNIILEEVVPTEEDS